MSFFSSRQYDVFLSEILLFADCTILGDFAYISYLCYLSMDIVYNKSSMFWTLKNIFIATIVIITDYKLLFWGRFSIQRKTNDDIYSTILLDRVLHKTWHSLLVNWYQREWGMPKSTFYKNWLMVDVMSTRNAVRMNI